MPEMKTKRKQFYIINTGCKKQEIISNKTKQNKKILNGFIFPLDDEYRG